MNLNFQLYFLENRTPPLSNIAHFWRKGGCGYTAKIDEAEQFTEHDADRIIKSAEGSHIFIKHPIHNVIKAAFRVVNIESLGPVPKA
jgi:hypothetical protein